MAEIEPEKDEYGEINVFSEERYSMLKAKANEQYVGLCEIIKRTETAIAGFKEWAQAAEMNEKRFYNSSKEYIETLKKVETEGYKPKF